MAENTNSRIHIGQLNLRISSNSKDSAHRIVEGIGKSLDKRTPAGMHGRFGALNIRVPLNAGGTEAEMSDVVAQAILRALGK